MSIIESLRTGLGFARDELYHCWECDANFQSVTADECVYCETSELRPF